MHAGELFFGNRLAAARFTRESEEEDVAQPPKSTPHSDIDGVHQDEKPNTETAEETGETTANLELARGQSKGKPPHTPNDEPPPR